LATKENMVVSLSCEMLPSMGHQTQPLFCVTSVAENCLRTGGERRGWRQISVSLWYPGPHAWYNGRDNGLPSRKAELIPSNLAPVRIGGCNSPPWSRNR